jgi:hypothetical protein
LYLFGGQIGGDEGTCMNDLWSFDPTWIVNVYTYNVTYNITDSSSSSTGTSAPIDSSDPYGDPYADPYDPIDDGIEQETITYTVTNVTMVGWTWLSPDDIDGMSAAPSRYGSRTVPASTNMPPARRKSQLIADPVGGALWLFGGQNCSSFLSTPEIGLFNDLWSFNLVTKTWTWMHGCSTRDMPGRYGSQQVTSATSYPGARYNHGMTTDRNGVIWMCCGRGYNSAGTLGDLNDVWQFDTLARAWTYWSGGSTTINVATIYSGASTLMGARWARNSMVIDHSNNMLIRTGRGRGTSVTAATPTGWIDEIWSPSIWFRCAPGTYKASVTATGCTLCPSGTFGSASGEGRTTCEGICPIGHYCPTGTGAPLPCPAGTFGAHTGLSTSDCDGGCPVGYYCPAGSTAALPCPTGTTSKVNSTSPLSCECIPPYAGNGPCVLCPMGTWYNTTIVPKNITITTIVPICISNTTALNGTIYCNATMNGTVTTIVTEQLILNTTLTNINGTWVNITTNYTVAPNLLLQQCQLCPAGKYGGSLGLFDSECSGDCPSGYSCPGGSTQQFTYSCPIGTYSYSGSASCLECPFNSTTEKTKTENITDCLCIQGWTNDENGTCIACGEGYYKDTLGSNECTRCPSPYHTSAMGTPNLHPTANTSSDGCICIYPYESVGDTCIYPMDDPYESIAFRRSALAIAPPLLVAMLIAAQAVHVSRGKSRLLGTYLVSRYWPGAKQGIIPDQFIGYLSFAIGLFIWLPLFLLFIWGLLSYYYVSHLLGLTVMLVGCAVLFLAYGFLRWRAAAWRMDDVCKTAFTMALICAFSFQVAIGFMATPYSYIGLSSILLGLDMAPMIALCYLSTQGMLKDMDEYRLYEVWIRVVAEITGRQMPTLNRVERYRERAREATTNALAAQLGGPEMLLTEKQMAWTDAQLGGVLGILYMLNIGILIGYAFVIQQCVDGASYIGFATIAAVWVVDMALLGCLLSGRIQRPSVACLFLLGSRFLMIIFDYQYYLVGHSMMFFLLRYVLTHLIYRCVAHPPFH